MDLQQSQCNGLPSPTGEKAALLQQWRALGYFGDESDGDDNDGGEEGHDGQNNNNNNANGN